MKGKTLLFITAAVLLLLTRPAGAQPPERISVRMDNVTVKAVLDRIQTMTDYAFFYNNTEIDDSRLVSVDVKEQTIPNVLSQIIPGVRCSFDNRKIFLSIEPAEAESQSQAARGGKFTIRGTIRDENGEPLPGASAVVKQSGKTYGSVADIDGKFILELPSVPERGQKLEFSCIGFADISEAISGRALFEIQMKPDSELLAETVVVGYGVQKKVNLTGAVSAVTAKDIENRPVATVGQALQGLIPNLNVTISSGSPSQEASFNIRGNTSPNGGSPLVLVDGVETNLSRINPNDIESISVLKDASSAAIYGARGAFGVILVTTKSGKADTPPQVTFDARYSFSDNTVSTDFETRGYYSAYIADLFMSTRQGVPYTSYTDYDYQRLWERRNDVTENPERPWVVTEMRNGQLSYVYLANFDWYNWMFDETRPTQDYNVNVSGGSKNVNYMVSGRYYHQDGNFRIGKDYFDSYNVRAKTDVKIRPWLRLSTNMRYFARNYYNANGGRFRQPYMHALASLVPVNPDGTAVSHTLMTNSSSHYVMDGYSAMLYKGKQWSINKRQEVTISSTLTADLTKHLKMVLDYSYAYQGSGTKYRDTTVEYSMYPGIIAQEPTSDWKDRYDEMSSAKDLHVANAYISYENAWGGDNDHSFTGTAGINYENYSKTNIEVRRDDLLSEDMSDFNLAVGNIDRLTGGVNEYELAGLFYRFTYSYKGRYLAETNGRLDGSSRFLKGHQWGFFPSASLAWRLSEEPWMASAKRVMNNLKIRASYGSLGNQNIDNYAYYQTVSTSGHMNYTLDGKSHANHATVSAPVSSGTWETVTSADLGLDAGFWEDRLTFTGDVYVRDTKGILTTGKKLPSTYGATEPLVNANDLRTFGWEIQLSWKDSFNIGSRRFDYTVGGSLSDYKAWYTRCDNPSGILSDPYVGKRLGEIWGFRVDGLFANDAEAAEYASQVNLQFPYKSDYSSIGDYGKGVRGGDLKYLDLNGDGKVDQGQNTLSDPGDRVIIGNSQPRFSYGFNLGANFCGFDFSVFFQGIGHQDWYPSYENMRFWGPYCRPYCSFVGRDFMKNVWSETNTDAYFPRARGYAALNGMVYYTNDRYLQNLAYIRLKNLSFGYSLPEKLLSKIRLSGLRVYFAGENLWYWSPLKKINRYVDPEHLSSNGNSSTADTYTFYKTFSFGVTVKF